MKKGNLEVGKICKDYAKTQQQRKAVMLYILVGALRFRFAVGNTSNPIKHIPKQRIQMASDAACTQECQIEYLGLHNEKDRVTTRELLRIGNS